jgi:hypothetical protein
LGGCNAAKIPVCIKISGELVGEGERDFVIVMRKRRIEHQKGNKILQRLLQPFHLLLL